MRETVFDPIPDYHMHTPRCSHAVGSVVEYAEAALSAGLQEIGISDHSPMPDGFDRAWRMDRSELDGYFREVAQVQTEFSGRLIIKTALEADFRPGTEHYVQQMLAAYNWDYVIGSVHHIGDWAFDNPDEIEQWDERDVEDAYCSYYALLAASAESGLFDIVGHPDLIKKFAYRPPAGSQRVLDAENMMLAAVKEAGVALEISSAGLRKPVKEIYPHVSIVSRAADMGIVFAFGSDAHAPGEVGHGMQACMNLLKSCGITEIATFTNRVREMQVIKNVS